MNLQEQVEPELQAITAMLDRRYLPNERVGTPSPELIAVFVRKPAEIYSGEWRIYATLDVTYVGRVNSAAACPDIEQIMREMDSILEPARKRLGLAR